MSPLSRTSAGYGPHGEEVHPAASAAGAGGVRRSHEQSEYVVSTRIARGAERDTETLALVRARGPPVRPGGRTAAAVAAIVVLLGIALLPVYRSPLVAGGDAVNVIRLFE